MSEVPDLTDEILDEQGRREDKVQPKIRIMYVMKELGRFTIADVVEAGNFRERTVYDARDDALETLEIIDEVESQGRFEGAVYQWKGDNV